MALAALGTGLAGAATPEEPKNEPPFPVGEKLGYSVSWVGIRCGSMEISSFVDAAAGKPKIYRVVLEARTSRFFDRIYKVRSRLESFVDADRMASVRYEEHSVEKKRQKNDVWVLDFEAGEARRERGDEVTTISMNAEHPYDPLAFIYRLRTMDPKVGDELSLTLMTSKGAVETVARATTAEQIRTKLGKRDAVAVVPEPRDGMMFSKSGSMAVWIEKDEPRRPCRIEFDLSFGKLVANLESIEVLTGADGGTAATPDSVETEE